MGQNKQKRTIVFDLDGALETPYFNKSNSSAVMEWMAAHPAGNTFDKMYVEIKVMEQLYPHFFLNGTFELLQWVHVHGFEIVFFSNGVEERNRELCAVLMERAFGDEGDIPPYRVLSRNDCVNTQYMKEEQCEQYQGLWFGNYKKKLADIVVPEAELQNTLMIEDDNSYAVKGEERNFIYGVYGGCVASFIYSPKLTDSAGQDFHLPFYFCGMLARIVNYAEQHDVTLVDAAIQVQYRDYNYDFPQDGTRRKDSRGQWLYPPIPPQTNFRIFLEGLAELRAFNPLLAFWGAEIEDNEYQWPPLSPPPSKTSDTGMIQG